MFNLLYVLQWHPELAAGKRADTEQGLLDAASRAGQIDGLMLQSTLPGVYNGGDLLWRLQFADQSAHDSLAADTRWQRDVDAVLADRRQFSHVDTVRFNSGLHGGQSPGKGVYRAALFSVARAATPDTLQRFERETSRMADYIHTIRRWQLSRVSTSAGARRWSFVWEQEYADLTGLTNQYMMHPYHWGHIDRWFDPESPDWIIDPFLVHTYCATTGPVIGA